MTATIGIGAMTAMAIAINAAVDQHGSRPTRQPVALKAAAPGTSRHIHRQCMSYLWLNTSELIDTPVIFPGRDTVGEIQPTAA
jgi:hypothetical protein